MRSTISVSSGRAEVTTSTRAAAGVAATTVKPPLTARHPSNVPTSALDPASEVDGEAVEQHLLVRDREGREVHLEALEVAVGGDRMRRVGDAEAEGHLELELAEVEVAVRGRIAV